MGTFYFLIFILGLATGSFLNSIIYRLHTEESFLLKRSYCPHCKNVLSWKDLIPLLSFVILGGKCRYCQNPISLQYPLVEFFTGVLFVLVSFTAIQPYSHTAIQLNLADGWWAVSNFFYLLFIVSILIIIFVYDLKHYIIPDKVIYPAILVSGIWYLVSGIFLNLYTKYEILNTIYSAFGAAAFFLLIVLISKGRWMGLGDPKLAFFMGLLLGFPNILVALFLAFLIGAIIGIGLITLGRGTFKSEIPFGPFLVTGTFIALFWGKAIIDWYLNFFW